MTKYDVAATVAVNDLEGYGARRKFSAKEQRELFGWVPFGRKTVRFDSEGQGIAILTTVDCTGSTVESQLTYEQIAQGCRAR